MEKKFEVKPLTEKRRQLFNCPRHGKEFLVQEGSSVYCAAPTPGEVSAKCFYHPRAIAVINPAKPRICKKCGKKIEEAQTTKNMLCMEHFLEYFRLRRMCKVCGERSMRNRCYCEAHYKERRREIKVKINENRRSA